MTDSVRVLYMYTRKQASGLEGGMASKPVCVCVRVDKALDEGAR
jgi:hypothetical protein